MFQSHPTKAMSVILAAASLGLAGLAASARQQEQQPADGQQASQGAAESAATGVAQPQGQAGQPSEASEPADGAPAQGTPDGTPATGPATAPATAPASQPAPLDEKYLNPVLAERLYEMAQSKLREAAVTEPMWRQAAALLQAASRVSPKDPRFPRLLAEARLKVGDVDGAIEALAAYRRIDPADRIAQIQLIDLYVRQMQSADARLDYLRDLLDRSTIPEEVRSHVAALSVPLLLERSQEQALAMLEESLRLFPLNPQALRLQYELLPPDAPPPARVAVLQSLLKSNPAQPGVVSELADALASVGMNKESLEWYSTALRLYPRMSQPFPDGFIAGAGAQLLLAGQTATLDDLLSAYLAARPDDPDAWFVRLAKEKAASDKLERKSIDEAWNALAGSLGEVSRAIVGEGPEAGAPAEPGRPGASPATGAGTGGATGGFGLGTSGPAAAGDDPVPGAGAADAPTTRPAPRPATAADAMAAAKRIKAGEAPEWAPALIATLTDMAWLELYFAQDAEAAVNWVNALREILPPDSVTLARLEGWLDLVAGRAEQARAKLAPIADRDPLAAVGMVRLAASDAGGQADADATAARLLGEYRTGLVGAMVWSALKGRNVKAPESPFLADTRAEVEKFPRDWMEILNQPDAYYEISAEVGKVAHKYREPMLGRVMIVNKTDFDLTIGENGVIRPDLWFDGRIVGLVNQAFPGVAYDRIARHVVLRGRQSTGQIVRLDQGQLAEALARNPSASAQISFSVVTNPSPTPDGVGPGPAGQREAFSKSFVRSGFPLAQNVMRKRVTAAIENGTPGEKIRNLDLLAGYLPLLANAKPDPALKGLDAEFVNTIGNARRDENPPVAMWANYLTARFVPDERPRAIDDLLASEAWPGRLLALLASAELGPQQQAELAGKLAEADPEPTVREYAAATVEHLQSAPATQPATQPAVDPNAPIDPNAPVELDGLSPIPGLSVPSDAGPQ